jgi:hypothetical protein
VKGKCKNSPTPSKQNLRIMGIEEGEEVQEKEFEIYSTT